MDDTNTAGLAERLQEMGEHPCRAHLPMGADLREAAATLTAQAAEIARRDVLLHEALQLLDANIRSKTRDDNAEQQLHVKIRRYAPRLACHLTGWLRSCA